MKAIITIGISGSGKTTWAESQEGFAVVCRDNIRYNAMESEGNPVATTNMWKFWDFKREKEVTGNYWALVEFLAEARKSIILADTNLNPQRRLEMQKRLESLGYEVEFKQFDISYEEAIKRDRMRLHTVGERVIYKQWLELYGEVYNPSGSLPEAILVDVDGTLAHMATRGPFEWSKVGEDTCDQVVNNMISSFKCQTIVMSGRDSVCRKQTEQWLKRNGVHFDHLFMRSEGDIRKDSIVKRELFDNHIRDKFKVIAVFDDRPQVVREWNRLGLKVIACADQMKEF